MTSAGGVDARAGVEAAVRCVGLTKRFGGRRGPEVVGLDGVDLTVGHGAVAGIMGPNGSGKSTLLRILATLLLPTSGTATVHGHDVTKAAAGVRGLVGFSAGDERGHYLRLTGRQNLDFVAGAHGLPDRVDRVAVQLARVGLGDVADRRVSTYSQGMVRRLSLARAALHEPAVLLLDEPTRSLDPAATADFHDVLRADVAAGRSVVLVTHDVDEAVELCREVTVLDGGTVRSLHHDPTADELTHAFFGRSTTSEGVDLPKNEGGDGR